MAVCVELRCAGWRENTQQGTLVGPGWRESAGIFGCPVGGSQPTVPSGREWNGSQPGQGAAERLSPRPADPEDAGSTGDAERVSRPAREKNRRRRVLVVTIRSPRPIRAVQLGQVVAIVVDGPARRRWRRSGPRGDGSARRRT